jgi:hypothetical protein
MALWHLFNLLSPCHLLDVAATTLKHNSAAIGISVSFRLPVLIKVMPGIPSGWE